MAYVYNQNNLSPLFDNQSNTAVAQQQQQPQPTSSKSKFQDPNKILSKNQSADQSAVNTAVTGKAQQQFDQNNAQLDQQAQSYKDAQKQFQPQAVADVAGDIKAGGNKLSDLLNGPQYKASDFKVDKIQEIAPAGADYSAQSNLSRKGRAGDFYTPGEANLDSAIFKQSGKQAQADSQLQNMRYGFQTRLANTVPQVQAEAQAQGLAAQQSAQTQARAAVQQYRDSLSAQDQADFQARYAQSQDQAYRDAISKARAKGLGGVDFDRRLSDVLYSNSYAGSPSTFNQNNGEDITARVRGGNSGGDIAGQVRGAQAPVVAPAGYISQGTLADRNVAARLLGENQLGSASNADDFINSRERDNRLEAFINSSDAARLAELDRKNQASDNFTGGIVIDPQTGQPMIRQFSTPNINQFTMRSR